MPTLPHCFFLLKIQYLSHLNANPSPTDFIENPIFLTPACLPHPPLILLKIQYFSHLNAYPSPTNFIENLIFLTPPMDSDACRVQARYSLLTQGLNKQKLGPPSSILYPNEPGRPTFAHQAPLICGAQPSTPQHVILTRTTKKRWISPK